MDISTITRSVQSMLDSTVDNAERAHCYKIMENYKVNVFQFSDLSILCSPGQYPAVILFGLQCLKHRLRRSWTDTSSEMKREIKCSLLEMASNLDSLVACVEENKVIPVVLSQIFVHLIKLEWPQQWPSMVEDFLKIGERGPSQARLVLSIFLRLYEDVIQFQDIPPSRRRDIVSGLNEKLLPLFSFALDLVTSQLSILESTSSPPNQSITLCREAVLMLSGFLDTCRTDVLADWVPRDTKTRNVHDGLPFTETLIRLIGLEDTRIDALGLLSVLLKRKPQSTSASSEESFKLLEIMLRNNDVINRIAFLVCSLLNEQPVFTETRYNCLVLFSEVLYRLGGGLITYWSELEPYAGPCDCAERLYFNCPNRTTHLLDTLLRLTTYPIRMVSHPVCGFWSTALRTSDTSLLARLRSFCSTLFMTWRGNLLKDGGPSGSGLHSEWSRSVFDAEDYASFYSRCRIDVIKCLVAAASFWSQEFLQLLSAWIETKIVTPFGPSDMDTSGFFTSPTSPALMDWGVLETYLENTLVPIKQASEADTMRAQFESTLVGWARLFLQALSTTSDPNVRGKLMVCTSVVLQQLDAVHDADLLVPLLNHIFTSFRYVAPAEANSNPLNRPKCVKSMHLLAATAFFRFTRALPDRMMPHFQAVASEVSNLWTDTTSGVVEKSVLLESLITLCFRIPQPVGVQFDLLKQLLCGVLTSWSPAVSQPPGPMAQLLTACASGGPGLISVLGLDQPITSLSDFEAAPVQVRVTLTRNVLSLLAITRRLVEPVNMEQIEQITVPLLEPITSSVLMTLRAFNELWQPETLSCIHPEVAPAFDVTGHTKACLLSFQTGQPYKGQDKTPLDRLRSCLHDCHEHLLHIVGSLFLGLRPRIYALRTDQLALVIHQGCCAAFEHLPDLRLNSLIRLVIRPFIRCCPKEHLGTALVPLLPPIVEALVQRLDTKWNQLSAVCQTECADQDAVAEELFNERLARLLNRTFMELMRLIYTFDGCNLQESQPNPTEPDVADAEDVDDVDMAGDAKPGSTATPAGSVGTLAQLLAATGNSHALENGAAHSGTPCTDTLFLSSLVKCLAWPDNQTCMKAAQWIPSLIDVLTQTVGDGTNLANNPVKRTLPAPLAEAILFGILCGLHVNGNSADSNLCALLSAALRVYHAVELSVVQGSLRNLVTHALSTSERNPDSAQSERIIRAVQVFEEKLFNCKGKPLSEKAKREELRKLLKPVIGVPLSQRFRDEVSISCLAPLARSKWRKPRPRKLDAILEEFGLAYLFS